MDNQQWEGFGPIFISSLDQRFPLRPKHIIICEKRRIPSEGGPTPSSMSATPLKVPTGLQSGS